jgi:large subunit ribosomal protein L2
MLKLVIKNTSLPEGGVPKKLNKSLKSTSGRNNLGRQTFFHKGGGSKIRYKLVDFFRLLKNIPAIVRRIDYDPTRTAAIALISYSNEILSYIIAPQSLKVGMIVTNQDERVAITNTLFKPGYSHLLKLFPVGSFVHNVELRPSKGGQFMRAYNSSAVVLRQMVGKTVLKLKSGEYRVFNNFCNASLGIPDNVLHKKRQAVVHKAGINRHFGKRPVVRGCAMNPVDHPHGGNTSSKFGSFTPWGKVNKGPRTAAKFRLSRNNILKYRVRHADARIAKLSKV